MPAFKAQEASGLVKRNRNLKAKKSKKSPKAKKCKNSDEVIRDNKCVLYTDATFDVDIEKGTIPTEIGLLTHKTRLELCK
jgi:hypothetical protein